MRNFIYAVDGLQRNSYPELGVVFASISVVILLEGTIARHT